MENFVYQHVLSANFYSDNYCRDTSFLLPCSVVEKYHLQATVKHLSHSLLKWK